MREMRRGDVSYSRSNSIGLEFVAQHHAARDGLEKQEAVIRFRGVTRQASASISAFYLGNAPAPRCWMGLRNISRRRSFGPQRSKMSLALIQTKAGTVRRRSSENTVRYLWTRAARALSPA